MTHALLPYPRGDARELRLRDAGRRQQREQIYSNPGAALFNRRLQSLDQLLLNVLNHARREGVFAPWCYVLADPSVGGTLACCSGYTLAKTIIERRDEFGVSRFLIDDISRLSRNTIESLRHGELAEATGFRVVAASDGHDSVNPRSSLLLPVLGWMNDVTVPLRKLPKYEVMLPKIVEMPEAGSGPDLISRARGVGAAVVRDALHLHRTGHRPPGRVDGQRCQRCQPVKGFVPKYQQIAPAVDRRRKAGEGFDRLARELNVSRPTIVRAYDYANRDAAAAVAREGRTPTRPPSRWSAESRAVKRKPRAA